MSDRREDLLERALEYVLANGVAGLSLRPLAAAVGTSARLLVYHFGSRDGLITALMDQVRAKFQASFGASVAHRQSAPRELLGDRNSTWQVEFAGGQVSVAGPSEARPPQERPQEHPQEHPMLSFWESLTSPDNLRYVRLLVEVQVLALQNPAQYARYLEQSSTSWLELIEAVLPPSKRSRVTATLCAAVIDGLTLELLSTGDRRRTTEALELFVALLGKRFPRGSGISPPPTRS